MAESTNGRILAPSFGTMDESVNDLGAPDFGEQTPLQDESKDELGGRLARQDSEYRPPGSQRREVSLVPYHGNGEERTQAIRKPVLVDMDSDDEIIWQMKQAGYKDEPVRDRLIEENRTRYDAKTIATRYGRMRRTLAAHEKVILDEDFSDYHEEEDELLRRAYVESELEYNADLARTNRRRWAHVADLMNEEMGRKKWTDNTTQERYTALENGDAILPIELDPNREARTARRMIERQARQAASQAQRTAEKEAREHKARMKVAEEERKLTSRSQDAADRERRRAEAEAKTTARKLLTAERAQAKRAAEQEKAAKAAQTAIEREQKKKAKEDDQVARAWQKDQEVVARRTTAQEDQLAKIQAEADKKKKALTEQTEHNTRRELIRRFFRDAGLKTAAPVATVRAAAMDVDDDKEEGGRATLVAEKAIPKKAAAPTTTDVLTQRKR